MATGGTGGHIYPAVATARELISRGHTALMLGQRGGMEERVAAEQGLEFVGVDAGKLARSGQGLADPRQLLRAAMGVVQARRVLAERQPGAVVGYGGFASLPGILAAQSLRIPTVLHEQNALLGLTQKLAVHQAQAVGTSYKEVKGLDAGKATLVGMPVRENRMERREALTKLGLRDGPLTILVMGGSQGSLFLNQNVPGILEGLFPGGKHDGQAVQVLHQTGPRWIEQVTPTVAHLPWYHVSPFVDAVAAWSATHLGITRAGTSTLAEAAFHGVPLVMVPLPESAENHQFHNATSVQEAGAGRVVEQADVTGKLGEAVLECVQPGNLTAMQGAARHRAQPGAAARFADLIEHHLRSPHS